MRVCRAGLKNVAGYHQYREHLNSSVIEANELGQVISYEEYYPYGRSAYRAATSGVDLSLKRYRFTGKERDEETGLDYFGVRYYASWLGRWTSSDPGGFVDGLNLYRYARNNPVNGIDREGYSTEEVEKPKPPPAKKESEGGLATDNTFDDGAQELVINDSTKPPHNKHLPSVVKNYSEYIYKTIEGANNFSFERLEHWAWGGKTNENTVRGLIGEAVYAYKLDQAVKASTKAFTPKVGKIGKVPYLIQPSPTNRYTVEQQPADGFDEDVVFKIDQGISTSYGATALLRFAFIAEFFNADGSTNNGYYWTLYDIHFSIEIKTNAPPDKKHPMTDGRAKDLIRQWRTGRKQAIEKSEDRQEKFGVYSFPVLAVDRETWLAVYNYEVSTVSEEGIQKTYPYRERLETIVADLQDAYGGLDLVEGLYAGAHARMKGLQDEIQKKTVKPPHLR